MIQCSLLSPPVHTMVMGQACSGGPFPAQAGEPCPRIFFLPKC